MESSTSPANSAQTPPEPVRANPLQRLGGIIIAPVSTLARIVARPDFAIPLVLIIVCTIAGSIIMTPRIDFESGMRAKFDEQGISQEQQDRVLEMVGKVKQFTALITAVSVPAILLIIAGLFLLLFRLFGWEEGTFRQLFSVTTYSWIPQLIKSVILTGVMFPRKSIPVEELPGLLKSNLGFLADPLEQPAAYSFLSSLDVFNLWTLTLLIVGLALAARRSRTGASVMVVSTYLFYVLGKVALAALGAMG